VSRPTTIGDALGRIAAEAESGQFSFLDTDEDVHSSVERRLGELVGDVAGKLHTGRSRNDQIALDLRLYLRDAVDGRISQLLHFVSILIDQAKDVGSTVVPSYTHVQQAQAVPLAHHLLAYAWMLSRDVARLRDARERIDVSPLGAGASGGSSLALDPAFAAERLGMRGVFANSMDAVGSRDLAAEFVWCVTQAMVHLSRLSEELVLWCSSEFNWVTFADAFTTGSSAMPQKKNADIAELARGKTATVIGDLTTIMTLQKGLPMTYNRDLQEDKRAVFHADDTLSGALEALGGMVASAVFDPPSPEAWVTALDLAEVLVERGVPFRQAHHVVGGLVADLVAADRDLGTVTGIELVEHDERFTVADVSRLDPVESIAFRRTSGGGSMDSVHAQIVALEAILGDA
jgi:argininosuccinate lyase